MGGEPAIREAALRIPGGVFVIASAYEGIRAGLIARSAQICAEEPLLISVAVRKGHAIEPLIRDSRAFSLFQIEASDKLLTRVFRDSDDTAEPEERHDPFDSLPVVTLVSDAPITTRAVIGFDCEVVRHFDLEADHELYVGLVHAAKVFKTESA